MRQSLSVLLVDHLQGSFLKMGSLRFNLYIRNSTHDKSYCCDEEIVTVLKISVIIKIQLA